MKNTLLAILFSLVLAPLALAIHPDVQRYITEGNVFLNQGLPFEAEKMYVTAKGPAVDHEDIDGLLQLTDRFLRVPSDYHAHDSYYLANDFAETICTFAKEASDPVAECNRGMVAMNQCIVSGQSILATIPMTESTASKIRNTLQIAVDNLSLYQAQGCPR